MGISKYISFYLKILILVYLYVRYLFFICLMESTRDRDMEIEKKKIAIVVSSPRFTHLKTLPGCVRNREAWDY